MKRMFYLRLTLMLSHRALKLKKLFLIFMSWSCSLNAAIWLSKKTKWITSKLRKLEAEAQKLVCLKELELSGWAPPTLMTTVIASVWYHPFLEKMLTLILFCLKGCLCHYNGQSSFDHYCCKACSRARPRRPLPCFLLTIAWIMTQLKLLFSRHMSLY